MILVKIVGICGSQSILPILFLAVGPIKFMTSELQMGLKYVSQSLRNLSSHNS